MRSEGSDHRPSRAVLIGVSTYEDPEFPDVPAALNSLTDLQRVLTTPHLCGWSEEQVVVLPDPHNGGGTARRLRQFAREADDVLLIYYVGHGQLTLRGDLCLTVRDTNADSPEYTGISYEWVAQALRESPARVKVTILDCCFSGQAIEALAASDSNVADLTHVAGVYTLTATTRNRPAHVPPLEEQASASTSFTGELVDLIESGLPHGPPKLTFADIFPHLHRRLDARGLPRPKQRGTDTALTYAFTGNVAYQPDEPDPEPLHDEALSGSSVAPADGSTAQRSRLRLLITAGAAVVALGVSVFLLRPARDGGELDAGTTREDAEASHQSGASEPVTYALAETFSRHEGSVRSIAFSPDGDLVASASGDTTVRLWNPETGKQVADPLTNHDGRVLAVAFSPNGELLASGGEDGTIRLWNPETGKQVADPLTGHEGSVLSVAFSPDSHLLASGGEDGAVHRWDPETGEKHANPLPTNHGASVLAVAFSPNGELLASGGEDNTIRFWNPENGSPTETALAHNSWVFSVAFSPDGELLASASSDKTVRVWNLETGGRFTDPISGHDDNWTRSVAFPPSGDILASGGDDHAVRLWDPATGAQVTDPLTGHEGFVLSLAFSPDGELLASASEDNAVRVWKRMASS